MPLYGSVVAFSSLRLLRTRNYGLLWWSGLVSDAGTWMQTVALGALVTELTGSAGWGALVAAVSYLVLGIATPFAGVLGDSRDRRQLLIVTFVVQAVVATALAVVYAAGYTSPAMFVAFVAVEGALIAVALPTRTALLSQMVSRRELTDAIALGPASWNLGRAIGPALAGVIIAWGSYTWVFALNAASFVVVAIGLFFVQPARHEIASTTESAIQRLKAGARAVSTEPGCRLALMVISLVAITVSPFIALIPAMAQLVLDGTPVDTAHFVMAQGIGSVIGAFTFGAAVARFGHNRVLRLTIVMLCISDLAFALAPNPDTAVVALLFVGFSYVWLVVGLSAVIQLRVDQKYRARAISLFFMTLSVFYPLGAMFQGWLGDIVGVREVITTSATITLVISLLVMFFRPGRLDALDAPPAAEEDDAINPHS